MKFSVSKRAATLSAVAALLIGAGCANQGIIGKWATSVNTPGEKPAAIVITFAADGTASQTTLIMGHTVEGDYSYVLTDDQITETLTASKFDGKPMKVRASTRPTVVYPYKLAGDTLTLKAALPTGDMTLKRQ